uniref:Uncharacterized protein n=1 Tax=Branchiostoma floridae TaxID=7739 RepID=C3YYK8_BRAFL|eukprot:XP_002598636.1 hypothetical protein BRAFLDRAFT_118364 [Branchiostoma floridae]
MTCAATVTVALHLVRVIERKELYKTKYNRLWRVKADTVYLSMFLCAVGPVSYPVCLSIFYEDLSVFLCACQFQEDLSMFLCYLPAILCTCLYSRRICQLSTEKRTSDLTEEQGQPDFCRAFRRSHSRSTSFEFTTNMFSCYRLWRVKADTVYLSMFLCAVGPVSYPVCLSIFYEDLSVFLCACQFQEDLSMFLCYLPAILCTCLYSRRICQLSTEKRTSDLTSHLIRTGTPAQLDDSQDTVLDVNGDVDRPAEDASSQPQGDDSSYLARAQAMLAARKQDILVESVSEDTIQELLQNPRATSQSSCRSSRPPSSCSSPRTPRGSAESAVSPRRPAAAPQEGPPQVGISLEQGSGGGTRETDLMHETPVKEEGKRCTTATQLVFLTPGCYIHDKPEVSARQGD